MTMSNGLTDAQKNTTSIRTQKTTSPRTALMNLIEVNLVKYTAAIETHWLVGLR